MKCIFRSQSIAAEIQCCERLYQIRYIDESHRPIDRTAFCLSASAKCRTPAGRIELRPICSVVSAYIIQHKPMKIIGRLIVHYSV